MCPQVLAPLGADVSGSRYLDPDGSFPNHIPNPEHPSAMASGELHGPAVLGLIQETLKPQHPKPLHPVSHCQWWMSLKTLALANHNPGPGNEPAAAAPPSLKMSPLQSKHNRCSFSV